MLLLPLILLTALSGGHASEKLMTASTFAEHVVDLLPPRFDFYKASMHRALQVDARTAINSTLTAAVKQLRIDDTRARYYRTSKEPVDFAQLAAQFEAVKASINGLSKLHFRSSDLERVQRFMRSEMVELKQDASLVDLYRAFRQFYFVERQTGQQIDWRQMTFTPTTDMVFTPAQTAADAGAVATDVAAAPDATSQAIGFIDTLVKMNKMFDKYGFFIKAGIKAACPPCGVAFSAMKIVVCAYEESGVFSEFSLEGAVDFTLCFSKLMEMAPGGEFAVQGLKYTRKYTLPMLTG